MTYTAYITDTRNSKAVFLDKFKATDYAAQHHGTVEGLVRESEYAKLLSEKQELEKLHAKLKSDYETLYRSIPT